jgi:heme A synthase
MTNFRVVGALISFICLVLAGLFIWGLVAGDEWRFWAIAAPVIVGFSAVLGIGFSIGRLMSSTKISDSPENPPEQKKP